MEQIYLVPRPYKGYRLTLIRSERCPWRLYKMWMAPRNLPAVDILVATLPREWTLFQKPVVLQTCEKHTFRI